MNSDPSRSPRSSSPRAADRTGRRRPERRRAPADLLQGLGRVSGEASAAETDRADALALVGSHHSGVVSAVAIACGRMAAVDVLTLQIAGHAGHPGAETAEATQDLWRLRFGGACAVGPWTAGVRNC